jgi:hypothetical protein
MKKSLLPLLLLAGGTLFGAAVSIGVQIGPPPPPRVVRVQPVRPGPDYLWVEGYWYPVAGRYRWHDGYWSRPPYAGAQWFAPSHDGERYHEGYWEGNRGRFEHDHRWDRDRDRDYRRGEGDHDRDDRR